MRSSLALTSLILLASCSGGDIFNSGDQKQDQPTDQNTEKNQGDQQADDPVMVGGAYLACVEATKQQIECALNDAQTGEKLSLASYAMSWNVNGATAEQVNGLESDAFHQRYQFATQDYKTASVSLLLQKDSQAYEYTKSMSQLDSNLRAHQTLSLSGIQVDFLYRFKGTFNNSSTMDCKNLSPQECLAKLFSDQLLKGINGGNKICNGGSINYAGITKSFTNVMVAQPSSVRLSFPSLDGRSCVEKSAQGGDGIFESGGCYIVPLRHPSQGLIYHVARAQSIPDVNRLRLFAQQKLCR